MALRVGLITVAFNFSRESDGFFLFSRCNVIAAKWGGGGGGGGGNMFNTRFDCLRYHPPCEKVC